MNPKNAIITAVALLLAGVAAVAFINRNNNSDDNPATQPTAAASPSRLGAGSSTPADTGPAVPRSRLRDPADNPNLINQYGESRTHLSKQVANTVVELLDDAISMGEMAASGQLGAMGGRGGLQGLGNLVRNLDLSEDQQANAAALYADFQKRELEKSKTAVESLRKNPEPLMRVMLASDAYSRGEISETEYKAVQAAAQSELAGVMNPLDRRNFQGGRPLADETFGEGMQSLLEPDQAETFQDAIHENAERNADRTGSLAEMPPMDLEQLDKTITSAKTVTAGFRQVMEGFGGLQELGPILEQQRQQQEQQRQGGN